MDAARDLTTEPAPVGGYGVFKALLDSDAETRKQRMQELVKTVRGLPLGDVESGAPTKDEVERRRLELANRDYQIRLRAHSVRHFNTLDAKQAAEYSRLYEALMVIRSYGGLEITNQSRHFIPPTPSNPEPQMLVYLEWLELDLPDGRGSLDALLDKRRSTTNPEPEELGDVQ